MGSRTRDLAACSTVPQQLQTSIITSIIVAVSFKTKYLGSFGHCDRELDSHSRQACMSASRRVCILLGKLAVADSRSKILASCF
jgi:hypothetical protein